MTTPKPIDPQDIRVGMRVRLEDHLGDDVRTVEFTVADRESDFLYSTSSKYASSDSDAHTWTLLADAPKPQPAVGSHWRDPETGAEYVFDDEGDYMRYRHGDGRTGISMIGGEPSVPPHARARLVPIPAFDPAALWPRAIDGVYECREKETRSGFLCCRDEGHDGLHAAYAGGTQPVYVWGDPR